MVRICYRCGRVSRPQQRVRQRNGPAGECCRRLCRHRLPEEDVELGVLDLSEAGLVKSLKGNASNDWR
jgi:hypothetical protein